MAEVETVRGPIDTADLGTTLMHEHADPTVIGLGRDIERIARVTARTELNIIVATGIYTYNDVPLYFQYRGMDRTDAAGDPMTKMSNFRSLPCTQVGEHRT